MTINPSADRWIGRSVPRVEDPALLTGRARFVDDMPTAVGTMEAVIVRSPHGHATIRSIDVSQALKSEGVAAVVTGEDVKRLTRS
ncbi:hypothetical protein, partial [Aurantimonas coralicida]|uniref:hypothetical protein n=1 Tax=Aurantimonas coralicida TaxID=182270 RepID=UPI0023885354